MCVSHIGFTGLSYRSLLQVLGVSWLFQGVSGVNLGCLRGDFRMSLFDMSWGS